MLMCIQKLVKLCLLVLKILSGNEILTSIKGRNSVANLRNLTLYNPNLDIINVYMYTNLDKLCPLVLKILSRNEMVTDLRSNGITEKRNDGRTGQIQYSPTFSKRGYNNYIEGSGSAKIK